MQRTGWPPPVPLSSEPFSRGGAKLVAFLDEIWTYARSVDPTAQRDLAPAEHRRVFNDLMTSAPETDAALADALYRTFTAHWRAYSDAAPTLAQLRAFGVTTVALSNMGADIRDVLQRERLLCHLDAVILSSDVGKAKPDPGLFQDALNAVGALATETLMVGDTPGEDAGGVSLGIRTLILPRTRGPIHGLSQVTAMVAGANCQERKETPEAQEAQP